MFFNIVSGVTTAFLPIVAFSLLLFDYIDKLVDGEKKSALPVRMAYSVANGLTICGMLVLNEDMPTTYIVVVMAIVIVLEHMTLSGEKIKYYKFILSAVFHNYFTVYLAVYSAYQIVNLDYFEADEAGYQRAVLMLATISCMPLLLLPRWKRFPINEIKKIIHSNHSMLLNTWWPIVNTVMLVNGMFTLPDALKAAPEGMVRSGFYIMVNVWALTALLSSYIIVLYQCHHVKYDEVNAMLKKVAEEKDEITKKMDLHLLTGMLNKTAWRREVKKELASERGGCMIIFDLDNFKLVNDNFGHQYGDRILIETADMMRDTFRKDDILGHIGGDEFAVFLCGGVSREIVEQRLTTLKIRRKKEFNAKNGEVFTLSFSAGYTFAPEGKTSYEALVEQADIALYQQKAKGKNGFSAYRAYSVEHVLYGNAYHI